MSLLGCRVNIYLPQGMSWQEGMGYIPNTSGVPGGVASREQIAHLAAMQARQSHVMQLLSVLERFNGNGFVIRAANEGIWRERA